MAAINKMDLVDFQEDVFLRLRDEFAALAEQLGVANVVSIPISALGGDNVVTRQRPDAVVRGAVAAGASGDGAAATTAAGRGRCGFRCST